MWGSRTRCKVSQYDLSVSPGTGQNNKAHLHCPILFYTKSNVQHQHKREKNIFQKKNSIRKRAAGRSRSRYTTYEAHVRVASELATLTVFGRVSECKPGLRPNYIQVMMGRKLETTWHKIQAGGRHIGRKSGRSSPPVATRVYGARGRAETAGRS